MSTITNGLSIDRSHNALYNFLALINAMSAYQYTGDEFTIGLATTQTPVDSLEGTNSQVTITAVENGPFLGSKTFRYARLLLGAARGGAASNYTTTANATRADTIQQIFADHNLVDSEIVVEGEMPSEGQTSVWTLTSIPGSLLYTGQIGVTVFTPAS